MFGFVGQNCQCVMGYKDITSLISRWRAQRRLKRFLFGNVLLLADVSLTIHDLHFSPLCLLKKASYKLTIAQPAGLFATSLFKKRTASVVWLTWNLNYSPLHSSPRSAHAESIYHHPGHQDYSAVRRVPDRPDLRWFRLRESGWLHQPQTEPEQADHDDWRGTAVRIHCCYLHRGEDWKKGGHFEFFTIFLKLMKLYLLLLTRTY